MDNKELLEKVNNSIQCFLDEDRYLLENNINERSITHKLAEHLQTEFRDYHVDCEYNKNKSSPDGEKQIWDLKERIKGCLKIEKVSNKRVYPDIIIHERGEGTNNLCIIEVKKTTSKINDCYDKIKLDCYTDKKNPGNLKYELGLFIKFIARKKPDSKTKIDVKYIECYTNGENNNDLENYFRELLTHNG